MEPRAHEVVRDRVRLAVWEWPGQPPGALLLHGIGNYGRYWDFVAEAVAGRQRLIAPDARGHGGSDAPPSGYADEDFVADALAVADTFGLGRFVLAGHSLGGRHGVALAAGKPERVRGLLLIDAGPDVLPEGRQRARRLTAERPPSFAHEDEALAYLRQTSPGYSDAVYANRLMFAFARREGRLVWRSSRDALLATMRSGPRGQEAWAVLREVRCPTVVLRGTRSSSLGAETARKTVAALPDARLSEVDSGHNVPLERPAEVAAAILDLAQRSS